MLKIILLLFVVQTPAFAQDYAKQVFNSVKRSLSQAKVPVVVFDLDSTLLNNGPRSHAIMLEYTSLKKPKLFPAVRKLDPFSMPYLIKDHWTKAGINSKPFIKDYFPFWKERFFSDKYQIYDTVYFKSLDLVKKLYAQGATIVYLTGRDQPRMFVGTSASLRQYGFPIGLVRTTLLMKPDPKTDDTVYKATVVKWLADIGDVVATFENEPKNANLFQKSFPKALNYWIDTNCAHPEVKLSPGVKIIKNFASKSL